MNEETALWVMTGVVLATGILAAFIKTWSETRGKADL